MHGKTSVWGVGLVGLGILALCAVQASAATLWPSNSSGSNSRFGWSGGEYSTGRFGSPNVDPAGFHFVNPVNFKAERGVLNTATDFVDVNVNVDTATPAPADPLPTILIKEWGIWHSNSGLVSGNVAAGPTTSLTGIRPEAGISAVHSFGSAVTYGPYDSGLGYGTWYAEYLYTPSLSKPIPERLPWVEVVITVTDNLYALSTGSWIQKDGMEIIIPEPSTVLLLLGGFGAMFGRSRRR